MHNLLAKSMTHKYNDDAVRDLDRNGNVKDTQHATDSRRKLKCANIDAVLTIVSIREVTQKFHHFWMCASWREGESKPILEA